jgi:hypothetical protein
MGAHVNAGDLKIWTEQVGQGPDVLLIGGAGDCSSAARATPSSPGSSSWMGWPTATA